MIGRNSKARLLKNFISIASVGLFVFAIASQAAAADALEEYVRKPDPTYSWKRGNQQKTDAGTVTQIEVTSQQWREHSWTHHMQVVTPKQIRNKDIAFLFITGDGDGKRYLDMLRTLSEQAGAIAAVITKIPNQPLYDGRVEDALIAFTFDRYMRTGDESWPLLFPMVKSAVKGMDTVQAFAQEEYGQKIERFVVSGASKRGWTTWLTGAVDSRVKGIAPMVIDMLNMKAQTQWAAKMYGKQSEQISDYTELNLVEQMDHPAMVKLRQWVDPYSYRERYTMPKLILLGTNDPYWVVDSLRHYWNDLPEPKLVFQTPNAGHDLAGGKEAIPTLAAFFQMIADRQELPKMSWKVGDASEGKAELSVTVDQKANSIRLWTAESPDRDFRNDQWASKELEIRQGSSRASAVVEKPSNGYRAYMGEVTLTSPTGQPYKLSTEARVVPDNKK